MTVRSLVAVVTPAFTCSESVEALVREVDGPAAEVRLVAPAVATNSLDGAFGEIDEPRVEARGLLERALVAMRKAGVVASGEVGDADPVQAAQDALLVKPGEEVLIFCHDGDCLEWYEGEDEGAYIPGITRSDMTVMLFGIVGTITAIILAAAGTAGASAIGWNAVGIGVAIAIALVNMSNVVGTLLMESVRYHGGWAKLFRDLALVGTPLAVLANLAILLFA